MAVVVLGVLACTFVRAEAGDWLIRVGTHYADPKSDNHDLVEVEAAFGVTFSATYFFTPNWAVEVLAALPFTHDIKLKGGPTVAETKHLPPTVSLQYHFMPDRSWRPYIGAGVNYTIFFQEDTTGPLSGLELELDDSIGLSAQLGVDIDLSQNLFLNLEVRYIDIETDASLAGSSIGTVEIDPWAAGLNIGFRI
ncbi:MAG: outer membrane beta-barrel protein [Proteobacteria bacterium]|nr:outer membrane beta-barrel protein [Pseudomonadota bacterium]